MKVLLLGASGLLGHNVLIRLMAEGHDVRVLVRRPDAVKLDTDGWDTIVGRLTDQTTLMSAAMGCDAIVNCAGVTDMSLLHRDDYKAVNCDLCAVLVQDIMPKTCIKTLVHVSTANTIGYGSQERYADEEAPMQVPFVGSYYAESKRSGEEVVLEAGRRHDGDWHVVVINPGFMLGPWDVKPSSGQMLLAAYRKPLMAAPRGGKAFVHVGDVAQAVVVALTRGRNGERYIAVNSEGCLSVKELYQMQAKLMGYSQQILTVPDWLLSVAGKVGDAVRAMGVRTQVSTRNVRQLMVREYYCDSHAVTELGMPRTPISQAIKDFYEWRNKKRTTI